ncbi:hypothetical protein Cob_v002162 [Colletotrichum orbiculare MAFF 240422]|uniref:Uncharacterized protein n=1 Tax=Colletotrichum orbiculare (strain 104-T / ATCC 96160 / CBS 514.97 / LARS 414 / MAFF 240422) TaxID=1213857 RepID=N4VUH3_COLOR|nr:hypothetical protein Cob_v002162 [Colletotrichum orbiculare MAFF 240422]
MVVSALLRFIFSFGLLSLALSQSNAGGAATTPDLPWVLTFGRPSNYDSYWNFDTSSIPADPIHPFRRVENGLEINVFRGPVDGGTQQMIQIHVESSSSNHDVFWQVYNGGSIVTRYSAIQHRPQTTELQSNVQGTFAMIPYQPGTRITLYWRLKDGGL